MWIHYNWNYKLPYCACVHLWALYVEFDVEYNQWFLTKYSLIGDTVVKNPLGIPFFRSDRPDNVGWVVEGSLACKLWFSLHNNFSWSRSFTWYLWALTESSRYYKTYYPREYILS
jgi:hypothetical protein